MSRCIGVGANVDGGTVLVVLVVADDGFGTGIDVAVGTRVVFVVNGRFVAGTCGSAVVVDDPSTGPDTTVEDDTAGEEAVEVDDPVPSTTPVVVPGSHDEPLHPAVVPLDPPPSVPLGDTPVVPGSHDGLLHPTLVLAHPDMTAIPNAAIRANVRTRFSIDTTPSYARGAQQTGRRL